MAWKIQLANPACLARDWMGLVFLLVIYLWGCWPFQWRCKGTESRIVFSQATSPCLVYSALRETHFITFILRTVWKLYIYTLGNSYWAFSFTWTDSYWKVSQVIICKKKVMSQTFSNPKWLCRIKSHFNHAMLTYSCNVKFSQNLPDGTNFYRTCPSVLQTLESQLNDQKEKYSYHPSIYPAICSSVTGRRRIFVQSNCATLFSELYIMQ